VLCSAVTMIPPAFISLFFFFFFNLRDGQWAWPFVLAFVLSILRYCDLVSKRVRLRADCRAKEGFLHCGFCFGTVRRRLEAIAFALFRAPQMDNYRSNFEAFQD